jgi:hypothetical protein
MPAEQLPAWVKAWHQPEEWQGVLVWPREDLPLLTVEIDHLRWVRQFGAALHTEGGPSVHWPPLDHRACRFGLWLSGSGKSRYGHLPSYARLVAVHADVHDVGADIMRTHEHDPEAARGRVGEIHACRDRLLAQLTVLRDEAKFPHH